MSKNWQKQPLLLKKIFKSSKQFPEFRGSFQEQCLFRKSHQISGLYPLSRKQNLGKPQGRDQIDLSATILVLNSILTIKIQNIAKIWNLILIR